MHDLVDVHDVEGFVAQIQAIRVTNGELGTTLLRGLRDDLGRRVDPDNPPRGDAPGEVTSDRAGPAPDVEQVLSGPEVWQQMASRVLGRPPKVAAQHGLVVAVGVPLAHATSLPDRHA